MDIKKIVKSKYSRIAGEKAGSGGCSCSCAGKAAAKSIGYTENELQAVGGANLGLGCGNPVAFSGIKTGDTVVDLGCGAGIDCFLATKKTGPAGKVIGIDFTEEMIVRAKANALKGKFNNIEFMLADIDNLPLKNNSADVIISNCVINLAPDKTKVFREAYRALKPNGALFVSDIVLLRKLSAEQKKDEELISGCVAGALLKEDYLRAVKNAGFRVNILNENKKISKEQYQGIPLESLLIKGAK